jgi:uncharacterized protein YdeI (YjbR/CyaY-like superfamily)
MSTKNRKLLDVGTRSQWRSWLEAHFDSESEIWLVFHKRHTDTGSITYDDSVEEALCFGWIDSIILRLDDDRYARKFTPRKPESRWSTINRRRYEDLKKRKLLLPAGVERAPTGKEDVAPKRFLVLPPYMEKELKSHPKAWDYFNQLAPSYRRLYIGWIDSAKQEATRAKRLREAIGLLKEGRKLGLK